MCTGHSTGQDCSMPCCIASVTGIHCLAQSMRMHCPDHQVKLPMAAVNTRYPYRHCCSVLVDISHLAADVSAKCLRACDASRRCWICWRMLVKACCPILSPRSLPLSPDVVRQTMCSLLSLLTYKHLALELIGCIKGGSVVSVLFWRMSLAVAKEWLLSIFAPSCDGFRPNPTTTILPWIIVI